MRLTSSELRRGISTGGTLLLLLVVGRLATALTVYVGRSVALAKRSSAFGLGVREGLPFVSALLIN